VQKGKVVAVDLNTGKKDPQFNFVAVGTLGDRTRGGDVWNAPSTDGTGVYFTTGNTQQDAAGFQSPEPRPNYGLSMIRVDKDTGNVIWGFQPVPYLLDLDADWSAGATVMSTSRGKQIASVQKDGWSYAVDAATGSCNWQFPPVTPPIADRTSPRCKWTGYSKFDPGGPVHGDGGYMRPGAAWNDVLILTTGGEELATGSITAGYGRLHALNACAPSEQDRVRWISDIIPSTVGPDFEYSIGAPTVTGGIMFALTNSGHLVALADPLVDPTPIQSRLCSNLSYPPGAVCSGFGYGSVPVPRVLADIELPGTGSTTMFRHEAVLAEGRVFVSTYDDSNSAGGSVYMLEPSRVPPPGKAEGVERLVWGQP
jgi:hypothetical protein